MGRETKLDDLREKRICDALKAGHSYASAARAGGVDEATLHRWRQLGRDGDARYREFCERVDRADREAEDRCIQVLRNALEGEDPKLATDTAWKWLERRRPADWAAKRAEQVIAQTDGEQQAEDDEQVTLSVLAAIRSRKVG
jgi:transposase-like protein